MFLFPALFCHANCSLRFTHRNYHQGSLSAILAPRSSHGSGRSHALGFRLPQTSSQPPRRIKKPTIHLPAGNSIFSTYLSYLSFLPGSSAWVCLKSHETMTVGLQSAPWEQFSGCSDASKPNWVLLKGGNLISNQTFSFWKCLERWTFHQIKSSHWADKHYQYKSKEVWLSLDIFVELYIKFSPLLSESLTLMFLNL